MSRFKQLLVALDFSDCSWDVAAQAIDLAKNLGAQALLLHVEALPAGVSADTPLLVDATEQRAGDFLHARSSDRLQRYGELFQRSGIETKTLTLRGPIAETVLETAREQAADMIVMGTHGRRGMARLLSGSVAEKVLRLAPCPVLTVRAQHQASCQAASCEVCDSHVTRAARRLEAEADG